MPIKQLAFGQENYAFHCAGCGARLAKKTYLFPLMMVGGFVLLVAARLLLGRDETLLWGAIWASSTLVVGFLTTRVWVAGDDVPDPPKVEVWTGPPPQNPTFRGSSGPPPKRDEDQG